MVHFDFILKDVGAENLMDWINNEKSRLQTAIVRAHAIGRKAEVPALKKAIKYVDSVKKQMKNRRCTIR